MSRKVTFPKSLCHEREIRTTSPDLGDQMSTYKSSRSFHFQSLLKTRIRILTPLNNC